MEGVFRHMTRQTLAGIWFGAVAVPLVGSIALGAHVSVAAGALLLLASLMPPLIILCVRPDVSFPAALPLKSRLPIGGVQ
jgi:hypothetical protein